MINCVESKTEMKLMLERKYIYNNITYVLFICKLSTVCNKTKVFWFCNDVDQTLQLLIVSVTNVQNL